ncbi:uncharacterized protein LOC116844524 isoform X2 [Odontomachus brunneus]|uniref:uncharacterized protein LOC116844524 isoform X2 n=1 Tax=Odontomachus brunneus TaxID=486640 RepID=UPI0013F1B0E8|nr:uncharacterized protein LOC116844524 isoform X2 [Odontomachus brunneus]
MASRRSSSPLIKKNCDLAISRLLLPLQNLHLRNHERADFSFTEPYENNESWSHVASVITPPSENIVVLPNAPLKRRYRFPKKNLRPRKLSYSENHQDTIDSWMADQWKEKILLPQVVSGKKGSVLRNKLPGPNNKENRKRTGSKPRNLPKEDDEKGKIDNFGSPILKSKHSL